MMAGRVRNRRFNQSGFSMVEVLVAISIFAIGGLMVLTTTTSSLKVTSNSRSVDEGVNIARQKMEELMGLDYDDVALKDTNADGVAGLLSSAAGSADHSVMSGRYRVSWNIASDTPVNGAKRIAVIVSWTEHGGSRQVAFQTIIAE